MRKFEPPSLPPNPTAQQYEQWRREAERAATQQMQAMNSRRASDAAIIFKSKSSLELEIKRQIYPALVSIESTSGRKGMGFFQHSQWLVSNAHVIRHYFDLANGIVIKDSHYNSVFLDAEQAYHRPYDKVHSPDLVLCKANSRPTTTYSALPTSFTRNEAHPEILYFYVDANFVIRYLSAVDLLQVPMLFKTEDGHIPQSGCSGSPIIAARVILGREPTWNFKTIAALYARCSSSENKATKLVCAVPIAQDFKQILEILYQQDFAQRFSQMAEASYILKDDERATYYNSASQQQSLAVKAGMKRFEAGASTLTISLPAELEQLAGDSVVCLEESYLPHYSTAAQHEIPELFSMFISQIQNQATVVLGIQDSLLHNSYWRVDCAPGTGGKYWVLQLQDNIPRGMKIKGKSASSIFAQIKIPRDIKQVRGSQLAEALSLSQKKAQELEQLRRQLSSLKGQAKKALEKQLNETTSTIIVGTTPGHEKEKYIANPDIDIARPMTPRTRALFKALEEQQSVSILNTTLNQLPSDGYDRVNAKDLNGNTPLMVLLDDPQLSGKHKQQTKAKLLVQFGALWNQPNSAGVTAKDMFAAHPEGRLDFLNPC